MGITIIYPVKSLACVPYQPTSKYLVIGKNSKLFFSFFKGIPCFSFHTLIFINIFRESPGRQAATHLQATRE